MVILIEAGAFRVMCKYIELKKNRWYYRRRVPDDVQHLHRHETTKKPQAQLYFSLKTADKNTAARLADGQTRRLDALWRAHRYSSGYDPDPLASLAALERAGLQPGDGERHHGRDAITSFVDALVGQYDQDEPRPMPSRQDRLTLDILNGGSIPRTLTDAKEKHFELGKGPKSKSGQQQFKRAWDLLWDITGDIIVADIRRKHCNEFVSRLIKQGVSAETIKRYLSQIRPVISTAIVEFELNISNQFNDLRIANQDEPPRKPRDTFTLAELAAIRNRCHELDDERRWAIAMLSDTMCRLAEIIGLRKADVFLDAAIPYIHIRPTADRRLKTKGSERMVPLVGEALWACRKAMQTNGPFLLPIFQPKGQAKDFNPGTASAALNKWLRDNKLAGKEQTLHSLRHTMRDRLRNVEAPSDLIDRIGGWSTKGVGEGYGKGHGLEVMQKYMKLCT